MSRLLENKTTLKKCKPKVVQMIVHIFKDSYNIVLTTHKILTFYLLNSFNNFDIQQFLFLIMVLETSNYPLYFLLNALTSN